MSPVSVIVVSRGRPGPLRLCLTAIGQLCHGGFELVVVADRAGLETVSALGWGATIKIVAFEAANISAARNAGLAQAAGEIVAFLDDDAVPEPTWLDRLTMPFREPSVAATGGYVIGRGGTRLQWCGEAVNGRGETIALEARAEDAFEPQPPPGYAVKTEGTNMAFRRTILAELGGFDPAFRYYLDETDVNLRLAAAGGRTLLVPDALVHHGRAASERRRADRAPRDLAEIGASSALFVRKHGAGSDPDAALARLRAAQRRALLEHVVTGALEPRDVARLLAGLEQGFRDGLAREIAAPGALAPARSPFRLFGRAATSGVSRVFAGRPWAKARLRAQAAKAVAAGDIVTILRLSPTALPHRVRFCPGGWWEQTGGLFGPAARQEPRFRLARFSARVAREWRRIEPVRRCR